jgi:hypothetical protein
MCVLLCHDLHEVQIFGVPVLIILYAWISQVLFTIHQVSGRAKRRLGRNNLLKGRKGLKRDARGFFVGKHGAKGSTRHQKTPPGHTPLEGV